jgi:UDP-glucose 4-epimerase
MKCLDNPATFGKTYNVASGKKIYVRDLLHAELKAFEYNPLSYPIKYSGSTPGDTFGIFADIEAIKKDTSWEPMVSLSEGLKLMSEWALATSHLAR